MLANKSLVPERGLKPVARKDGEMAEMIAERKWDNFTRQPDPAAISIVKEFYANVASSDSFVVQVRGKAVAFSRNAINSYFRLPNIEVGDYLKRGMESFNLTAVIQGLCKPGTEWKLRNGFSEKG